VRVRAKRTGPPCRKGIGEGVHLSFAPMLREFVGSALKVRKREEPRVSRVRAQTGAHGRACALLLLACSIFLVSGSDARHHGPLTSVLPSASATSESALARVRRSLARANPVLAARDHARIASAVVRYSERYGLDPDLVTAVVLVESDARPWAHSPKGAVGLMQVMPHMMGPLDLAGNAATIESNIEAGCFILSGNIERLGEARGISAYFWGSRIRNASYLEKVLQARARVRGSHTS